MMERFGFDSDDSDEFDLNENKLNENSIQWKNIIFVPFHPLFQFIMLFVATIKAICGPLSAISKTVHCTNEEAESPFYRSVLLFYTFFSTPLYFIDMLLFIMHRQVQEIAVKREHVAKSGVALLIDIVAILPWFTFVSNEECPEIKLWPNILAFNEILVLYRVVEYFKLMSTHSLLNIAVGFTLVVIIILNCFTCLWILLTMQGLCKQCPSIQLDWRVYLINYIPEEKLIDPSIEVYSYGATLLAQPLFRSIMSDLFVQNKLPIVIMNLITIISYCTSVFVILPKLYGESMLRFRKMCSFQPHVMRVMEEARRRNEDPFVCADIEKFYQLVWSHRSGITGIPKILYDLPIYLVTDIKVDLTWPLIYHSPTFRRTSDGFRRWIAKKTKLYYKAPGEILNSGVYYAGCFYYLKTGIVQMISADDGNTPLISVYSGSVFGDVNFLFPPLKSKIIVRCMTYCEVHIVLRRHILKSLQKFPKDRREIFERVNERLQHARDLHAWKIIERIEDRREREGIDWLKARWWLLAELVLIWRKYANSVNAMSFEIPSEQKNYHCSKHIGQLVLCKSAQLQNKAIFIKSSFPWIMNPSSDFIRVWRTLVKITVFLVLIIFPPSISVQEEEKPWFSLFKFWTAVVFVIDVFMSLVTPTSECQHTSDFASVIFSRAKTLCFLLDILSTPIVEALIVEVGLARHQRLAKFTPLLKVYYLFASAYNAERIVKVNPFTDACFLNFLLIFSFVYITGYIVYLGTLYIPNISNGYFFDNKGLDMSDPVNIIITWYSELSYHEGMKTSMGDIYLKMFIVYSYFFVTMFVSSEIMAMIYLKNREVINLQYFVNSILEKYKHYDLSESLRASLKTYFLCHWKIYKGLDIKHVNNLLKDEPSEIHYNVYGRTTEMLLANSSAFRGANSSLIKELAMRTKFLVVPRHSTLLSISKQCEIVVWVMRGTVLCQYYDHKGEFISNVHPNGEMLSMFTILLGKYSMNTYVAWTDCEIIYIDTALFNEIISRYPSERKAIDACAEECGAVFDEIISKYPNTSGFFQKQTPKRRSVMSESLQKKNIFVKMYAFISQAPKNYDNLEWLFVSSWGHMWIHPQKAFYRTWMPLRAGAVVLSVLSCVAEGTYAAKSRRQIHYLTILWDFSTWMDIFFKFFLAYYNEKGLLIHNLRMIAVHYLVRGFVPDIIGVFPWVQAVDFFVTTPTSQSSTILWDSYTRSIHLYLFVGYCNYLCDLPDRSLVKIMIFKWQVVSFIMMNVMAHHLSTYCMDIEWRQDTFDFINMEPIMYGNETCFMIGDTDHVNDTDVLFRWIFSKSFVVAQYSFMNLIITKAVLGAVARFSIITFCAFLAIDVLFWFVQIYTIAMLVLSFRGASLFEDNINQLVGFLKNERVEKEVIGDAQGHFKYWWFRTNGLDVINPMMERVGLITRQEISLYFFETTMQNLGEVLNLSVHEQSNLACVCQVLYFLPGQDIMREMNLVSFVYIVHRGQIIIVKKGKKLVALRKGAMFGQLRPGRLQPVVVTARAEEPADILQIPTTLFYRYVDNAVITNVFKFPEAKNNYLPLKKYYVEAPEQTIEYFMRGTPTMKVPRVDRLISIKNSKPFVIWLTMVWIIWPVGATVVSFIRICDYPHSLRIPVQSITYMSDVVHFVYVMLDLFYSQHLVIIDEKCVLRPKKWKSFKGWRIYIDLLSFILPAGRLCLENTTSKLKVLNLARCLRLQYFYDYYNNFCKNFQGKAKIITLLILSIAISIHAIVCVELIIRCEDSDQVIKSDVPSLVVLDLIDTYEYIPHDMRKGGCIMIAYTNYTTPEGKSYHAMYAFKNYNWFGDYLYVLSRIIQKDIMVRKLNEADDYLSNRLICVLNLLSNYTIYVINIYIMSKALTLIYIKFRKMIHYDYESRNLQKFLLDSKLTITLLRTVQIYLSQLWQRQKGNWIPELVMRAPQCLRQDIMCSLYLHHFKIPSTFTHLPSYFLRQLTSKMHRTVVFPGKDIVKEGDILPVIFFIHEGEVEKYYNDKNGEKRVVTLLTTTGYFELLPAIFPNTPYQFSYHTKSVVDLVYLRYTDWQVLLDVYPDVKKKIYQSARTAKDHTSKN